jgi:two-component system, NtrC family, sensor kinase
VDDKVKSRESVPAHTSEGKGIGMLSEGFNVLAENLPNSLIITDFMGTILFSNNEAEKTFGYRREELKGMSVEVILPDGHRELTGRRMGGHEFSERPLERKGVFKGGSEFPAELEVSTWRLDGERYLTFVIRNIGARKLAEQALRETVKESRKKYEGLEKVFKLVESIKNEWERTVDCVGDMVILADNMGRVKRCNRTFKEFVNKAYDEIIGNNWGNLLFGRGIENGSLYRKGTEIFHEPSGKWFIVSAYPFIDASPGEISGEAITIHDSTELRGVTRELEVKNRELAEAYNELQSIQARVLQQEKMASIGQLAAGVAHEINNPMSFISSNLGSLGKYFSRLSDYIDGQSRLILSLDSAGTASRELDEKRRQLKLDYVITDIKDLIKESLDGAERVKGIVQDLKSFSRVEEFDYITADINAGLESTIHIVWNEIKYKATLKKEYGDIPLTRCNPGQLNQVFMNLLVNAAHAIDKQGEISVKTWHSDGNIFVSVSDTGCGIPQDKLSRIFEPFFTTKEAGKGTGLGLSIAYEILKKHGGKITVDSTVGKGTSFTLQVPVVQ